MLPGGEAFQAEGTGGTKVGWEEPAWPGAGVLEQTGRGEDTVRRASEDGEGSDPIGLKDFGFKWKTTKGL